MSRSGGAIRPVGLTAGIASVVHLALARPPLLGPTRLIAVDGPSGSGKSCAAGPLARALAEAIGGDAQAVDSVDGVPVGMHAGAPAGARNSAGRVAVVSTDLLATWANPLDWWPVLERQLLTPLARGQSAELPIVEWAGGRPRPGRTITVPPADVLVLEGVSSGRRAVAERLSALVWVEVPDTALRLERAVARDGESERAHLMAWQADEAAHFDGDGTRLRADIVIDPQLGTQ